MPMWSFIDNGAARNYVDINQPIVIDNVKYLYPNKVS